MVVVISKYPAQLPNNSQGYISFGDPGFDPLVYAITAITAHYCHNCPLLIAPGHSDSCIMVQSHIRLSNVDGAMWEHLPVGMSGCCQYRQLADLTFRLLDAWCHLSRQLKTPPSMRTCHANQPLAIALFNQYMLQCGLVQRICLHLIQSEK